MKFKIIALTFFLILTLISNSQSNEVFNYSITDFSNNKRSVPIKALELNNKIYVFQYYASMRKTEYFVNTFDSKMNLLDERPISYPKDSRIIDYCDFIQFNSKLYLLYVIKNETEIKYYAKDITSKESKNKNDLLLNEASYDKLNMHQLAYDEGMFDFGVKGYEIYNVLSHRYSYFDKLQISPDNKLLLLPLKMKDIKNNKLIANFKMIKENISNIQNLSVEIPISNIDSEIYHKLIDSKGNIVFVVRSSVKSENRLNEFIVYNLSPNKKLSKICVLLKTKNILDLKIQFSKDGKLLASGLYSDDKKSYYKGFFYSKIDYVNKEIIFETKQNSVNGNKLNLSKNRVAEIEKSTAFNRCVKNSSYDNFIVLKRVIEKEDGTILFITIDYKSTMETSINSNTNSNSHIPRDTRVISFNKNGNIDWIKDMELRYSSYSTFAPILKNDKLFLVYLWDSGGFGTETTLVQLDLKNKGETIDLVDKGRNVENFIFEKELKNASPLHYFVLKNNSLLFFGSKKGTKAIIMDFKN